ncbi:hypothetical protein N8Z27_00715 [Crocinitomicaceae bacterium]|nr:hypothetical protein [Crocinitomicaceae bacterium]MDC0100692.1 hypothetical protein [Crocinitomicaceae bacterium]MDC1282681.1 hypothetical protein [Crocinitomicaceae bacterium]MDC1384570.1 hypothetical protein [Crocinitomicaceae bacterium]
MIKLLAISMCLGLSLSVSAQKLVPKFTYNVELGLPVSASNLPFRDIMQGLASVNTFGQYTFPFHLNLGVGIKYSYFAVNQFSVSEAVFGGIHSGGAFLKVGYDKFYNDRFAMDFGVKVGYMEHYMLTDKNKSSGDYPVHVGGSLIEPTVGFILTADERNSYRFNIGYSIQGYSFSPQMLGLGSNENYEIEKLNNLTQYFYIGFGYTFYFGVKGRSD